MRDRVGGEVVYLGGQAGGQEEERERPSSLAEVVEVHPLHLVGALQRYTHAVVDHEVGEHLPVDQHHLVREPFGVLGGHVDCVDPDSLCRNPCVGRGGMNWRQSAPMRGAI